jgi:hypothetical protein
MYYVNVRTLKRKKLGIRLGMGFKWFKNQNVNAYYMFLGVHYFS